MTSDIFLEADDIVGDDFLSDDQVEPTAPLATERQITFLRKLVDEREVQHGKTAKETHEWLNEWEPKLERTFASELISAALASPRRAVQQKPKIEVPEGIHSFDGRIFKVQVAVHGSGRKYAKELDIESGGFSFAPGMVSRLSEATLMPLEEAKRFGSLYGLCVRCGRTLTDEASIEAGVGPICAEKFTI